MEAPLLLGSKFAIHPDGQKEILMRGKDKRFLGAFYLMVPEYWLGPGQSLVQIFFFYCIATTSQSDSFLVITVGLYLTYSCHMQWFSIPEVWKLLYLEQRCRLGGGATALDANILRAPGSSAHPRGTRLPPPQAVASPQRWGSSSAPPAVLLTPPPRKVGKLFGSG